MTNENASGANNPARPTIADIQGDAVILYALVRGLDHLHASGEMDAREGVCALISVIREKSCKLADDLDGVRT